MAKQTIDFQGFKRQTNVAYTHGWLVAIKSPGSAVAHYRNGFSKSAAAAQRAADKEAASWIALGCTVDVTAGPVTTK